MELLYFLKILKLWCKKEEWLLASMMLYNEKILLIVAKDFVQIPTLTNKLCFLGTQQYRKLSSSPWAKIPCQSKGFVFIIQDVTVIHKKSFSGLYKSQHPWDFYLFSFYQTFLDNSFLAVFVYKKLQLSLTFRESGISYAVLIFFVVLQWFFNKSKITT